MSIKVLEGSINMHLIKKKIEKDNKGQMHQKFHNFRTSIIKPYFLNLFLSCVINSSIDNILGQQLTKLTSQITSFKKSVLIGCLKMLLFDN